MLRNLLYNLTGDFVFPRNSSVCVVNIWKRQESGVTDNYRINTVGKKGECVKEEYVSSYKGQETLKTVLYSNTPGLGLMRKK